MIDTCAFFLISVLHLSFATSITIQSISGDMLKVMGLADNPSFFRRISAQRCRHFHRGESRERGRLTLSALFLTLQITVMYVVVYMAAFSSLLVCSTIRAACEHMSGFWESLSFQMLMLPAAAAPSWLSGESPFAPTTTVACSTCSFIW